MHSMIQRLLEANKIQVSSRVCGGDPIFQPVWNGQDLALYWLKAEYNNDDQVISTENIPLSDHDLLHEIAHWIAAAPEQRDLPEYGLGPIAFQTYHIDNIPSVVDSEESSVQEHLCWLLFGRKKMSQKIEVIVGDVYWSHRQSSWVTRGDSERMYFDKLEDAQKMGNICVEEHQKRDKGRNLRGFVIVRPQYNEVHSDDKGIYYREWRSFNGEQLKEIVFR